MFEQCGLQLRAAGGATDGTSWTCDQKRWHPGPHQATWEMDCATCDVPLVCQVKWDRHPTEHGLRNV